jgi:hypothetical protein
VNSKEDVENKNTCLRLGQEARLFFKDMYKVNGRDTSEYLSEFKIRFAK